MAGPIFLVEHFQFLQKLFLTGCKLDRGFDYHMAQHVARRIAAHAFYAFAAQAKNFSALGFE